MNEKSEIPTKVFVLDS